MINNIVIIQNMENIEEEIKVGKRVRGDKVSLIQEIIDALQNLLTWAAYDDGVKASSRGDLEAARERMSNRRTGSGSGGGSSGGANWNARVGETIIGNLGRGEGGRFISAANITSMMNQLEKENISPDMFTSMQDLLEGKEVDAKVLEQLKAVGLATDSGQATAKAAQIITAMKTGDPDKLKATLKESGKAPKKGGGKKPPKAPKPTKDEVIAKNIDDTGAKLIEQNRLTQNQLNALKMFANGETVDNALMQELVNAGLVYVDSNGYFSFTGGGNSFWSALEKADLRKALDSLNKSEAKIAEAIEEEQPEQDESAKIQSVKDEFVKLTSFPELESFLEFFNGKEIDVDFSEYGLTELDDNGKQITSSLGKRFANAIQKGKLREAVDAYRKANMNVSQKNFEDNYNDFCFGFKVLQNGYLLTWTTNAYEDREKETFTLKSIKDYVERNIENDNKGTYQFWHIPGSDFGDILWQGVVGKFLVEIGKFREDEIGQAFKKFFTDNPDGCTDLAPIGWGTSHGFFYRKQDREDGIYEWFDKKETTVLPLQEAANIYTLAEFMLGEKSMDLNEKQIEAVNKIGMEVGMPSLLDKILGMGKKRTEALDGAGIASKQAVMKTDDGKEYPAKCYAYVPDPEAVDTWKLRMCAVGTTDITKEQLGAAAAAFSPGGFMGNKVELPSEDVEKVKRKLRSEYAKLKVPREDMPESIKSLEVEVKDVKEKIAEANKACATDLRKKMDSVLSEMEKQDSDSVALVRQLSELVAQVENEELRTQLEELVNMMSEMLKPAEEEEPTTEEVVAETEAPVEEEMKSEESHSDAEINVDEIAKALKLDELSALLEAHDKAIVESAEKAKSFDGVVSAIQELVEKNKQLFDEVEAVKEQLKQLGEKAVELEKEDETKIAEKQVRYTPFWANRFQASKAAETVLSAEKEKEFSKPEVPDVIQSMTRKFYGGR
jgi:hypothetical protein